MVNYPLPLLTFISTSDQSCTINKRIKYYPWVYSVLFKIKISSLVISCLSSSHAQDIDTDILEYYSLKLLNSPLMSNWCSFFANSVTWILLLQLLTSFLALTYPFLGIPVSSPTLSSHLAFCPLLLLLGYGVCWNHQVWLTTSLCCPTITWMWILAWQPSCSFLTGFLASVADPGFSLPLLIFSHLSL